MDGQELVRLRRVRELIDRDFDDTSSVVTPRMFIMTLAWSATHPILRSSTDGGEGIILRPWSSEDAESIHQACQDPEIIRWTTVPYPYTQDHAASFAELALATWQKQAGASFAVADETTNAVLASCGLVDVDPSDCTVEMGYWVAPWARGRGVATAATRAVARWAIDELGAQRVSLEAASANIGSQQVALNAGFTREGVQRSKAARFGARHDMVLFSLLPGEETR